MAGGCVVLPQFARERRKKDRRDPASPRANRPAAPGARASLCPDTASTNAPRRWKEVGAIRRAFEGNAAGRDRGGKCVRGGLPPAGKSFRRSLINKRHSGPTRFHFVRKIYLLVISDRPLSSL